PSPPSPPPLPSPALATVQAQETSVATLRRALATGRVHHAYLFDGPEGVGKELAAFGLAQALVCERRGVDLPADEACGACSACLRALPRAETRRPVHPDVVVIERGLYEPGTIGRRTQESQDISIDQIRTLVLARASFAPHEGRAKVFVIRRAEELSTSAANALLKTLEEPNARTHFVLLTSQPDALLPTIRSRTQRVRFAPLPDAVVVGLLAARGLEPARAQEIARLSAGSMQTALVHADDGASAAREAFVTRALEAIEAPTMGPALELAEDAKKEKGELATRLAALASSLAVRGAAEADARGRAADTAASRYLLALAAMRELEGNASAQLVVESMMIRMRAV
ncbi:MAG TPA: DNA polymerase III subunit, partial [Polyangiaceae bacterium]